MAEWPHHAPSEYPETAASTVRDRFGYSSSWEAYARAGVRLFGFALSPGEVGLQS